MKKNLLIISLLFLVVCLYAQEERLISIPLNIIEEIESTQRLQIDINNVVMDYELQEFEYPAHPITVDGQPYSYPSVKFYKAKNAMALVTIYDGNLFVSGFTESELIRIQPEGSKYRAYRGPPKNVVQEENLGNWCEMLDEELRSNQQSQRTEGDSSGCILVDYHVNQSVFNAFGDIDTTVMFMTELLATVSALQNAENIIKRPSLVSYYTTENQWFSTTLASSRQGLDEMSAYAVANGIAGNSAHLIHLQPGLGGVAWLFGWDPSRTIDRRVSFSSIRDNFEALPNYSWSVMVIAHEEGHSAGAYHTHNCANYGTDSIRIAYDFCAGWKEGNCELINECPDEFGSIMSYGHLGPGIDVTLGYLNTRNGPVVNENGTYDRLPGDILEEAQAAWGFTCIEGCDGPGSIMISNITASSATATWTGDSETQYEVQLESQTPVIVTGPSVDLTGLNGFTRYCLTVSELCGDGNQTPPVTKCFTTDCSEVLQVPNWTDEMNSPLWGMSGGWLHSADSGYYYLESTNGDYGPNALAQLTSPCMISTQEFGLVRIGIDGESEQGWDGMRLDISTNRGNTWQRVGESPDFYNSNYVYVFDGPAWSGEYPTHILTWDISEWLTPGQEINFRFDFRSDPLFSTYEGPIVTFFEVILPEFQNCDSTVYDTIPVFDTTYVEITDTILFVDTSYVTITDTVTIVIEDPVCNDSLFAVIDDLELEILAQNASIEALEATITEQQEIIDSLLAVECPPIDTSTVCDTVVLYIPDPCPCKGNKIKVCFNGQTLCVPPSQVTSDMEIGACSNNPCPGQSRVGYLNLYPNPSSGKINVEGLTYSEYVIIDGLSRQFRGFMLNGEIDMSAFPPGIYSIYFFDVEGPPIGRRIVIK